MYLQRQLTKLLVHSEVKFGNTKDAFYICSSLVKLPSSEGSSPVKLFILMPLKEKVSSSECDYAHVCDALNRKKNHTFFCLMNNLKHFKHQIQGGNDVDVPIFIISRCALFHLVLNIVQCRVATQG